MGRVYPRNGAWYIDFTYKGRRRREKAGPNKKMAEMALKVKEAEIVQEKYCPEKYSNGKLFSEVIDKYWEFHGATLSAGYKYFFREVRERFGRFPIGAITPVDVRAFYSDVAKRASISTANRNLVFLSSVFNKMAEYGLFHGKNPCNAVKKGAEPTERTRYLQKHEMDALLAVCHPRLRPVVACALRTGMRSREILDLQWESVDLNAGLIHLRKTKNNKIRHVPISEPLREILESLGVKSHGSVFNLPFIMRRRFFSQAVQAAGLSNFRFHDLRHTYASWYMMKTGDIATLMVTMGHSAAHTTKRYMHLSKNHVRTNMALFETAIPPEATTHRDNGTNPALTQIGESVLA